MSIVIPCPTCGTRVKFKEKNGLPIYQALTDEEKGKKIQQLKKAMIKFREKAETLEKELEQLKSNMNEQK